MPLAPSDRPSTEVEGSTTPSRPSANRQKRMNHLDEWAGPLTHGVGFQPLVSVCFLNWTVRTYGPVMYCGSSRMFVTSRYVLPSGSVNVANHSVNVALAP